MTGLKIEVLGTGCPRCSQVADQLAGTAKAMGVDISLSKVSDIATIARHGVLSTPAVVIEGRVVHTGSVPTPDQIKGWLAGAQ